MPACDSFGVPMARDTQEFKEKSLCLVFVWFFLFSMGFLHVFFNLLFGICSQGKLGLVKDAWYQ